jgi:hypothetical protein
MPEDLLARFPSRVVFVGGGPPVCAAYAPFIRHWDISRLPYHGEANRWFNRNWLPDWPLPEGRSPSGGALTNVLVMFFTCLQPAGALMVYGKRVPRMMKWGAHSSLGQR